MNIGDKIKKIREEKRWTQQELAEKAHVSRVSIGNYERNDRTPDGENLKRIAEALGVTSDELLGLNINGLNKLNLSQIPIDVLIEELNDRKDFPIKIARK